MKTSILIFVCSFLLFNFSCTEKKISDNEKKEALQEYKTCSQIADQWLLKLDSSDYNQLLTLKVVKESNKDDSVLIFINQIQNTYGRIRSRTFMGAHIWSGKKLLTYFPDIEQKILVRTNMKKSEDGFYIINPKYLGFSSAGQMFAKFPEGRYIVLMYRSVPTKESYAEEAVILRYNTGESWEVFTYEISNDI